MNGNNKLAASIQLLVRHRLAIAWTILLGWHAVSLMGWLLQGSYPAVGAAIDPMVNRNGSFGNPEGAVEAFEDWAWAVALVAYLAVLVRAVRANGIRINPWFVLLPALCFMALGEEMSWGQHLFNWHAPDAVAQVNTQHETNLHNLDLGALFGLAPTSFGHRLLWQVMKIANPGVEGVCALIWVILPTLCAYNVGTRWSIMRQIPVPRAATRMLFVIAVVIYIVVDKFIIDCGELMELALSLLAALSALDLAFAAKQLTERRTGDPSVGAVT